ncbi:hypothetical protein [Sphingomonas sp. LT1P40]|uniref:hypothetical protein n=1 Tax=Alteristakelama amylovorans TaxID=3096166 RepID=UPI002FC76358
MRRAKLFGKLSAALGLFAAPALASEKVNWPDLPTSGFIADRPATVDDAKQGNAVFSMNGKSSGTVPITIPQYVWWSDEEGKRHPMILIQAELAPDGTKIVGLRNLAGEDTVATLPELELLGTKKPN